MTGAPTNKSTKKEENFGFVLKRLAPDLKLVSRLESNSTWCQFQIVSTVQLKFQLELQLEEFEFEFVLVSFCLLA